MCNAACAELSTISIAGPIVGTGLGLAGHCRSFNNDLRDRAVRLLNSKVKCSRFTGFFRAREWLSD